MKITIHRGTNQIGGSVTEYEVNGWHLFIDYGEQLPGMTTTNDALEIDGLTKGDLSKSILLITHYHADHIGKIAELPVKLPIYMGKTACNILQVLSEHLSEVDNNHKMIAERLASIHTFSPGEEFAFGDLKILPVMIDHSAFDAYSFLIKEKTLKVLHTGDFRSHGFRSGKFLQAIRQYIGKVDYVVCEGTNVTRPNATNETEQELQCRFEQSFKENKNNVVYVSSTNIDRIFGLYHAALRAKRPFYVDSYQKRIMDNICQTNNLWSKSPLFNYGEYEPIELQYEHNEFKVNQKFNEFLKERGYVLIARSNQRFDNLLARIPNDNRKTYLSMWNGYTDKNNAAYNPKLANSIGNDYLYMHTSGHCDKNSLQELFKEVSPKAVIPIHTNDPKIFSESFCEQWPILLLNDRETFETLPDIEYDNITGSIITIDKQQDKNTTKDFHKIKVNNIGIFNSTEDALNILKKIVYAPNRVVGFQIEDTEDMSPFHLITYCPDFSINAEYSFGNHKPGGADYQKPCKFKPGEKALAVHITESALIPCEIIGPVTKELLWENAKLEGFYNSYEDMVQDMWDWDWDVVAVRPLIEYKPLLGESPRPFLLVNRVHLFPYKELSV